MTSKKIDKIFLYIGIGTIAGLVIMYFVFAFSLMRWWI